MRCDEIQELIGAYVDGELPQETAVRMERHLLRCAACSYEARTMEQTRALLQEAIPASELSPAYREKAAARLLDMLAPHLRPEPEPASARQWLLPLEG